MEELKTLSKIILLFYFKPLFSFKKIGKSNKLDRRTIRFIVSLTALRILSQSVRKENKFLTENHKIQFAVGVKMKSPGFVGIRKQNMKFTSICICLQLLEKVLQYNSKNIFAHIVNNIS